MQVAAGLQLDKEQQNHASVRKRELYYILITVLLLKLTEHWGGFHRQSRDFVELFQKIDCGKYQKRR